jgi:hypothetical protein
MITKHVVEYIDWLQNTISRFKLDDNPECITCNGTGICVKEIRRVKLFGRKHAKSIQGKK